MKRLNFISMTRGIIVACAIGFLCTGSSLVAAQTSGDPRLPGKSVGSQERISGAPKVGRAIGDNGRPLDSSRRSRGAKRGYYIWLGKCWKGGGTIAMAFPPQSTLASYFNPHWTRVSMRFCADVRQPSSQ